MKIVVCVKRVPDTAVKVKIAGDRKSIDKSEMEFVVGPYDEIAVEHAVRIKEKVPGVEVVIISLGNPDTEKTMRSCLAMGADRGILLQTNTDTLDSYVVAKALSEAVQKEQPDLVLFGIKSVDSDNAQVGSMVATMMGIPFLSTVVEFEIFEGKIKSISETEGGHLVIETPTPCALSIQKSNVEPRICSLINIRKARGKKIDIIPVDLAPAHFEIEKIELPPDRIGGKIVGEGPDAVPELFRLLKEEAKVL